MDKWTTLTGIPLADVPAELDKQLEPEAYKAISGGSLRGLTDISPAAALREFTRVFGLSGIGWRAGHDGIEYDAGTKTSVILNAWLQVRYRDEEGELHWSDYIVAPGYNTNAGSSIDSLKGAWTNALGTMFHQLGWQNSVYMGKRSHAKKHSPDFTMDDVEEVEIDPGRNGGGQQAPAAGKFLESNESMRKAFHAQGSLVYGDDWDTVRGTMVKANNVESSNKLTIFKAQEYMDKMADAHKQAVAVAVEIAKAQDITPADVGYFLIEAGIEKEAIDKLTTKGTKGFSLLEKMPKKILERFCDKVAETAA